MLAVKNHRILVPALRRPGRLGDATSAAFTPQLPQQTRDRPTLFFKEAIEGGCHNSPAPGRGGWQQPAVRRPCRAVSGGHQQAAVVAARRRRTWPADFTQQPVIIMNVRFTQE